MLVLRKQNLPSNSELCEMSRQASDEYRLFLAEGMVDVVGIGIQYPESLPEVLLDQVCATFERTGAYPAWKSYYDGQWNIFGIKD